jgi:hypothetical protein
MVRLQTESGRKVKPPGQMCVGELTAVVSAE